MNKKTNIKPQQKSVNQRGNAPKSARKSTPQSNQALRSRNQRQKTPQRPQNPRQTPPQRPQNPPRKPANPKADKAIAAAMRRRSSQKRTRRFRGGNYILYYLLAAVVVIIVLIILANTVLFKCSRIEVFGNTRYRPDEIAAVCGIAEGDNLLRINTADAEKKIADALVYIDSASVKKHFPTRVEITVTEAKKWYCVEQNGITAAISRGGKVVEQCAAEDFPVVRGFEAESLQTGVWLKSKNESKNDIPATLLNAADKARLDKITSVDITDRFSIKIVVDGRITLELGSVSEAQSKLIIAKSIIDRDIGENDNITLLLSNPDKPALHYNNPETPSQPSSSLTSTTSETPEVSDPESSAEEPEEPESPPEESEDPE